MARVVFGNLGLDGSSNTRCKHRIEKRKLKLKSLDVGPNNNPTKVDCLPIDARADLPPSRKGKVFVSQKSVGEQYSINCQGCGGES